MKHIQIILNSICIYIEEYLWLAELHLPLGVMDSSESSGIVLAWLLAFLLLRESR